MWRLEGLDVRHTKSAWCRLFFLVFAASLALAPACAGGGEADPAPGGSGGTGATGATGGTGATGATGGKDGGTDAGDASTCVPEEEVCDGKDNDCDLQIDEDATDAKTWYEDKDGDGIGISGITKTSLQPADGLRQ